MFKGCVHTQTNSRWIYFVHIHSPTFHLRIFTCNCYVYISCIIYQMFRLILDYFTAWVRKFLFIISLISNVLNIQINWCGENLRSHRSKRTFLLDTLLCNLKKNKKKKILQKNQVWQNLNIIWHLDEKNLAINFVAKFITPKCFVVDVCRSRILIKNRLYSHICLPSYKVTSKLVLTKKELGSVFKCSSTSSSFDIDKALL